MRNITRVALALLLAACAKPRGEVLHAGSFQAQVELAPDPPVAGDNTLRLSLRDASGKPVEGARISFAYDMPAMGSMPEMKGGGDERELGGGRYEIRYPLAMLGDWALTLQIEAAGEPPAELRLRVSPPHPGYVAEGQEPAARAGESGGIEVSSERQQLIGVVYEKVARRPLSLALRASGRVEVDETRVQDVVLQYEAYVEKLFVSETGERVRKGQPLLSLYSPELLAAEQDYLGALRGERSRVSGADQLLRAATERLRLWGLRDARLEELGRRGKAQPRLTIYSPGPGTVLEKNVVEGTRAASGSVLYRIGDLGRVWVLADLFESDAPYVRTGETATLALPWASGVARRGTVQFVYPTIDEKTRSLRARLSFANGQGGVPLMPGMYVDVTVQVPLGTRLVAPDSALLASGEHRYAFVRRGAGRLLPVEVNVGAQSGGFDEVLAGLSEGDEVATQATFLLSSEAQLRDALPRFAGARP